MLVSGGGEGPPLYHIVRSFGSAWGSSGSTHWHFVKNFPESGEVEALSIGMIGRAQERDNGLGGFFGVIEWYAAKMWMLVYRRGSLNGYKELGIKNSWEKRNVRKQMMNHMVLNYTAKHMLSDPSQFPIDRSRCTFDESPRLILEFWKGWMCMM